jgi:hypothetical protein
MQVLRSFSILVSFAAVSALSEAGRAADVVDVARSFPDGGGYDKAWKGTGVPEDVLFNKERILARDDQGSYCCGYTFAVAMKVATERGLLRGKSVEDIRKFQKQWYGATEESAETQCVLAAETLGIGKEVATQAAQPGDFLQLWRSNKSGHSVIFLDWVRRDGQPIGLKYRSSQGSTDGIADHVEYFAGVEGVKGSVLPERLHFCRLNERRVKKREPPTE